VVHYHEGFIANHFCYRQYFW